MRGGVLRLFIQNRCGPAVALEASIQRAPARGGEPPARHLLLRAPQSRDLGTGGNRIASLVEQYVKARTKLHYMNTLSYYKILKGLRDGIAIGE